MRYEYFRRNFISNVNVILILEIKIQSWKLSLRSMLPLNTCFCRSLEQRKDINNTDIYWIKYRLILNKLYSYNDKIDIIRFYKTFVNLSSTYRLNSSNQPSHINILNTDVKLKKSVKMNCLVIFISFQLPLL